MPPTGKLADSAIANFAQWIAEGAVDPRTLIRRAHLDLPGLKPSYEEVEAFANDPAPDRYGEESGSGQQYTYGWRYRDWVIESLNRDLPYDRFVKLQLAADQVPGASREDLRRCHPDFRME